MMVALKFIGLFLRRYWPIIVAGLLVLAIFLYWDSLVTTIDHQSTTITKLTTENATLVEGRKQDRLKLTGQIKQQNSAISKFQNQSTLNQQTLSAAKDEVAAVQKYYNDEIQKIIKGNKPTDCTAAIKYLVDAAAELTSSSETQATASTGGKSK
jgi:septal ring factor EnvC (AmiA/AmiB activator)